MVCLWTLEWIKLQVAWKIYHPFGNWLGYSCKISISWEESLERLQNWHAYSYYKISISWEVSLERIQTEGRKLLVFTSLYMLLCKLHHIQLNWNWEPEKGTMIILRWQNPITTVINYNSLISNHIIPPCLTWTRQTSSSSPNHYRTKPNLTARLQYTLS